jgi:hypothetical protein
MSSLTLDPVPVAAGRRRLSADVEELIRAFAEREVCLREVLAVLQGRGFDVLLILLAFPFCTPIPLPGLSTPFGLVIAYIGLRLGLGRRPWLPARLLDKRLPPRFFPRFLAGARHLLRGIEYFLRPRCTGIMRWGVVRRGLGVMICVAGLLLLLPLPIPFSNFLPAITIVLLAAAMLENDGGAALAGTVTFLLTLGFFTAIFWGGTAVVDWLEGRFGGILDPDYETGPWP